MNIQLVETRFCPACGGENGRSSRYALAQTSVYRCRCGLEFLSPALDARSMMEIYRSSETLREINPALENYYEYDTLDPRSLTSRDYGRALEEVSRFTAGRDLLEAGCGTGSFLEFARRRGWNVTGVDSSPENIARLGEKGIAGIEAGFLECRPGRNFDVVVLWDLIEHPSSPLDFVRKSRELLKPGGLLLLATPHYPNLLSELAKIFYRMSGGRISAPVRRLYFLEHTSYFSRQTLADLAQKGGFRVVKHWKTETDLARYRFPRPVRWALKASFLLARLLGLQNRVLMIAQRD
ncbi:MAG: class I SAM-dependent methyltransferase [Candidatus Omnitrophica bacterium]|nr:class I SAM-dependent methyltransferase [Candidatus Omnitrophota bacterium]